jgi:hypothetical protein
VTTRQDIARIAHKAQHLARMRAIRQGHARPEEALPTPADRRLARQMVEDDYEEYRKPEYREEI